MNAWGNSWGLSWGVSWGTSIPTQPPSSSAGGGGGATFAWKRRNKRELAELLGKLSAADPRFITITSKAQAELAETGFETSSNLLTALRTETPSTAQLSRRLKELALELEALQDDGEVLAVFFLL